MSPLTIFTNYVICAALFASLIKSIASVGITIIPQPNRQASAPREVVLIRAERFAAAAHVGGRVDAADGGRKGHQPPAAVLPHLAIHEVPQPTEQSAALARTCTYS